MYCKKDLQNGFKALGILPTDTLMVHSSMKSIEAVKDGAEGVLDALSEYLSEGLLILPTHTWAQMGENHLIFHPEKEPSCVGLLTELFRKRPGVMRSLHPTHSVAALGKDAANYLAGEENCSTPAPRTGCWGRLYDRRAKILFLGCSLKRNTFLHSVEEWYEIPNRLTEQYFPFQVKTPDRGLIHVPMKRHYNPICADISQNYDKMEPLFLQQKIAVEGQIGDARAVVGDAVGMADLVGKYLQKNPDLFLDDAPIERLC